MDSTRSVRRWLSGVRRGDTAAAEKLWQRYFAQLVRLARQRLPAQRRRVADEEDIALSAMRSFLEGLQAGRFPNLHDQHGLWPLLVVITSRKIADQIEHQRRQKRGGGNVRGESAFIARGADASRWGIDDVIGAAPPPDFVVRMDEQCQRLLTALGDDSLRAVARWKLENWTNEEIAHALHCTVRSVERKLALIRRCWAREMTA